MGGIGGRCGLVVKVAGSGAEGPGFKSLPEDGVLSSGKLFTINFLLVCLVSVTRCGLRKGTCLCPLRATLVVKVKIQKYSDVNLEF